MEKKINAHHLYYTIAIAIIILVAVIITVPDRVSENAFTNFSFASTLASIVLAVISIVYSIYAGNTSSTQLDNVREIDAEIRKQLDGFSHIEENVSKLFGDLLLYACALSKEKNKPLPKELLEEEIADYNYWYGYIVALQMSLPDKIELTLPKDDNAILSSNIVEFDTNLFGTANDIRSRLSERIKNKKSDNIKKYLSDIDTYYQIDNSVS